MTFRVPAGNGTRAPRRRWVVTTTAAAGVAGLAAASLASRPDRPVAPGLTTPGPVTTVLLPLAELVAMLAALLTVGALLVVLLTRRPDGRLDQAAPRYLAVASRAAAVWAVAALLGTLLRASDIAGRPVLDVLTGGRLLEYLWLLPPTRTALAAALCALVVAVAARRVAGPDGVVLLLAVTGSGLALPVFTGHAATAGNHTLAVGALLVHVAGVAAWVGGLAGLALLLTGDARRLGVALPRFTTVATVAFVAVGLSGTLSAVTRLSALDDLWRTPYGWLVLAKVVALVVLGVLGWRFRRAVVGSAHRVRAQFTRLAGGELVLMAVTVGLAVALSRTPTP